MIWTIRSIRGYVLIGIFSGHTLVVLYPKQIPIYISTSILVQYVNVVFANLRQGHIWKPCFFSEMGNINYTSEFHWRCLGLLKHHIYTLHNIFWWCDMENIALQCWHLYDGAIFVIAGIFPGNDNTHSLAWGRMANNWGMKNLIVWHVLHSSHNSPIYDEKRIRAYTPHAQAH